MGFGGWHVAYYLKVASRASGGSEEFVPEKNKSLARSKGLIKSVTMARRLAIPT